MTENKETALWAWLLFDAGIKTYQAKTLLSLLNDKKLSLENVFNLSSDQLVHQGLGAYAGLLSRFPTLLTYPPAVRWNEPVYPQGLHDLTIREKPALLFYKGARDLLSRPIVILEPGDIPAEAKDLYFGLVELLLDGIHLPAAFAGSPQASVLLESMAFCEGEALIFIDEGLDQWQPAPVVLDHIQNERLIILSPMPPKAKSSPALTLIIQKVAAAAATRWITTIDSANRPQYADLDRPLLQIKTNHTPDTQSEPGLTMATAFSDVITWLQDLPPSAVDYNTETGRQTPAGNQAQQQEDMTPINGETALRLLESGGKVPIALRERLMGKRSKMG